MGLLICSAETKARSVCKLVTAATFGFLDLLEVPYYFFLVIFKRRVFNGFMRTIQALVIITLLSLLPTSLSLLLP
ncbi:hypothetical protein COCC4DRAFT_144668 [Bipolaris maydis ATCC 48331]|uniref:Uncharacterized protein n=2 Tax=Cochliobolus heterostrophus TaxID=5016 RepID=M2UVT4_COCH5|nr:uncharacterized protein COCC4DRAFT_144668 [Bipolaris maydis ATCC 48331]EMD97681.1 hypothetical protein COCHEDRAFT_1151274 [Bipolaris maydis C5]ENI02923.1 hypothetical protein COCC4DRAFT_144668 [Bipolaris maydis ATCC 48331]KAJ6210967.1 hypothetical protein PSV09DRAFT_1151274 [Bipolaris maydis]